LLANFGKEGRPEPVVPKISQETLAEMVGTTRSRISFFMNKFRKLGFLDYNGRLEVHSSPPPRRPARLIPPPGVSSFVQISPLAGGKPLLYVRPDALRACAPPRGRPCALAEDTPYVRQALTDILESAGAAVTAVGSAEAALAALQAERPDVLLSDLLDAGQRWLLADRAGTGPPAGARRGDARRRCHRPYRPRVPRERS